jgi:hypothetical protein
VKLEMKKYLLVFLFAAMIFTVPYDIKGLVRNKNVGTADLLAISDKVDTENKDERNDTTEDVKVNIDIFDTKKGDFYLGMEKEDVLKKLEELQLDSNIQYCYNDYIYIDTNSDNHSDSEDRICFSLWFKTEDNSILTSIDTSYIPTLLDLKIGDSSERMKELYGNDYILYENDFKFCEDNNEHPYSTKPSIYEFKINNYYFSVSIKDDKVVGWEVSQFKIEKNISFGEKTISTSCELKREDLEGLNKTELGILRNAYYARHGYRFKNSLYAQYFAFTIWYTPKYDNVDELLTETDIRNIDLILEMEKSLSEDNYE